jgi:hypothetical protein
MLPYRVHALLMALCGAPRRPSGSRISGFERVGQAVLNRGYERTPGVLAGEVPALAFEEIPMQGKCLVITLNMNRPDIHGGSLPYRDAGSVWIAGPAFICRRPCTGCNGALGHAV